MPSRSTALHTWLQLLRAPNLFTVPGDPLAGFLLASGGTVDWRTAAAILASLAYYSYGLLLNDLADLEEDRRERPKRPLPSGAAEPKTVRLVSGFLAALALLLSWACGPSALMVGGALLIAISTYNLWTKRVAGVGVINMGLCRGLSLMLGAACALPFANIPTIVFIAALCTTAYIAIVTNVARHETSPNPPANVRRLPFFELIATAGFFFYAAVDRHHLLAHGNIWLYLILAYALYAGFKIHQKLTAEPPPFIPPIIGQLIRLLLPLQAAFCVGSHSLTGGIAAAVLLILWPISRNVSKRFYAS